MNPDRYDPVDLEPLLYGDIQGQNAMDVGCNKGNIMSLLVPKFKNIFGFDPSEVSIQYLRSLHPVQGIRVFDLAISDKDGKVELELEEGKRKVSCRSIDSLTRKNLPIPDFIKVDVTGHEVQVLNGAQFLMTIQPPEWVIEIYSEENGNECATILTRFGYSVISVTHPEEPDPDNHFWIKARIKE